MAKVHDKYVIELAEVIKGYGNNPDVADPFRLSEFYRFYELPNIAVSRENFENMKPFSEVTDEQSCESCRYNPLDWDEEPCDSCSPRNIHWKPHSKELSFTHKALDTISRQAAIDAICDYTDDLFNQITALEDLPSAQPEIIQCKDCKHYHISFCKIWSRYGTVQTRETGFCYMAERKDNG